jgi:glycosyltransferase involved in cell wall biosynthesis
MRVLHVINNLGSGGAEKLIEESLPLLNKMEGVEADVLLLTDRQNVFQETLEEHHVNVHVVPFRNIYSPRNIFYIKEYIVQGKYDVVHAHLFPCQYWTSLASKLILQNKPKFVFTEHSTHNRRRDRSYLRSFEKFIYSGYDKIISISSKTQDSLISWLKPRPSDLHKFVVIENGIDIDRFRNALPYKKEEICSKFTDDVRLVCMVGRFSEQKDHTTLIKAIAKCPPEVHLLLVGEGPLKQKCMDLSTELAIGDRVHFLGFRRDVDRIYKTSDIVVLSSHWEGLPLVAVEGMAAGKPVVASDVPGLAEVVGGGGLLFTKGDWETLASHIINLLTNQGEYMKTSELCLARANEYTVEEMAQRCIAIYKKLISGIIF